jgi:dTDP-4-amino-4,6-dideoxygalactose transaminase
VYKPAVLGGTPRFETPLPLVVPCLPSFEDIEPEVREILGSGQLTKGRFLDEYEQAVAAYLGVEHAVAVSSATSGLMLVLMVLGIEDEVIVPSFTFMATVQSLVWDGVAERRGHTLRLPVFVDVDPQSFALDPAAVEAAIGPRTTAIFAVHLFGAPAPVEALAEIADRHGLALLYDAAHGFGALHGGRPLGAHGVAEVFSTSPTKLLVTGEGGVVTTNSSRLADLLRIAREYGNPGDYGSLLPGINARLPEFGAILGLQGLRLVDGNAQRRNAIADLVRERLADVPGLRFQLVAGVDRSSYKDLVVVVEDDYGLTRDELALALRAEGIATRNYYDPPVHEHVTYRHLAHRFQGALPVTEWTSRRIIALPCYPALGDGDVEGMCEVLIGLHEDAPAVRARLS